MKQTKVLKGKVRVIFSYDPVLVQRIKEIPSPRKWNPEKKYWEVGLSIENAEPLKSFLIDNDFEREEAVKYIDSFIEEQKQIFTGKEIKPLTPPDTLQATLRDYQIETFSYMVQERKCINGDEQGLGKTLETLTALEYTNSYPSVIVCLASLKYNWLEEIERFLPHRKAVVINSGDEIYAGSDIYIINYDIIHRNKNDEKLIKLGLKASVFDEAQKIKNEKALRSISAKKIAKSTEYTWLLSGTIIQNRPKELIHPLKCLNKFELFGGFWPFVNRYCNAQRTAFGLDYSGASNTDELFLKLSNICYIRHNKSDVAKELPEKNFIKLPVTLSNESEYKRAERDPEKYYKKWKEERGEEYDPDSFGSAEQLVTLNLLRQMTLKGKIVPAIEWIENFLESTDEKIIVFGAFREGVKAISDHFKWNYIDGSVSPKKRQEIANEIQNNSNVRGAVFQIEAGGTGLNVGNATTQLHLEQDWSAGIISQAYDRTHRINSKGEYRNYYTMVGRGTVDEDMYNMISEKMKVINSINAGELVNPESTSVFKEVAKKYFK